MKRCYVGHLMETVEGMCRIKCLNAVLGKKLHFIELDRDENTISRNMIIKQLSNQYNWVENIVLIMNFLMRISRIYNLPYFCVFTYLVNIFF